MIFHHLCFLPKNRGAGATPSPPLSPFFTLPIQTQGAAESVTLSGRAKPVKPRRALPGNPGREGENPRGSTPHGLLEEENRPQGETG